MDVRSIVANAANAARANAHDTANIFVVASGSIRDRTISRDGVARSGAARILGDALHGEFRLRYAFAAFARAHEGAGVVVFARRVLGFGSKRTSARKEITPNAGGALDADILPVACFIAALWLIANTLQVSRSAFNHARAAFACLAGYAWRLFLPLSGFIAELGRLTSAPLLATFAFADTSRGNTRLVDARCAVLPTPIFIAYPRLDDAGALGLAREAFTDFEVIDFQHRVASENPQSGKHREHCGQDELR
jgi:hypothetical protein